MAPETRDEMTDFCAGYAQASAGVDHEIRAAAFFAVAHLGCEDRFELFGRHSRPRQHAAALHMRGRGHDDRGIHQRMAAAFEQQRNIERRDRGAVFPRRRQKSLLRLPHHGVDDRFETSAGFGIAEYGGAELCAIQPAGAGRSRKGRLDRRQRLPARALQPVHLGIGIEDGHPRAPQHRRDRRLAHADRAGQTKHDHCASSAFSSSSQSSGGAAPKNSENAIAAWPISISSPSTVARPRASAARSSAVSSGL